MLSIITLVLGPVDTNTYIVADTDTNDATVVDPAWDGQVIQAEAQKYGWTIRQIWITHAHFDHIGGSSGIIQISRSMEKTPGSSSNRSNIQVALHPADLPLWKMQGGAPLFGLQIDVGPEPTVRLEHDQMLSIGNISFQVRHAPGHTPGHVIFYSPTQKVAFTGDVIFKNSIGRTDLPGGNYNQLVSSIHLQVLSLPGETRLFPGHGAETTVATERLENPFLV